MVVKGSKEAPGPDVRESGLEKHPLQLAPHPGVASVGLEQLQERRHRPGEIPHLRLEERRVADHLPGGDDSPGLEYPLHLGQDRLRIRNVHQHRMTVGDVERVVLEGKIGRVAGPEGCVVVSAGRRRGPGHLDLRRLHVDAVQLSGRHRLRQAHRDRSGTAAEVEDAKPGTEVGEQMRGGGRSVPAGEQLLEILAVPHGVSRCGGFGSRVAVHGFIPRPRVHGAVASRSSRFIPCHGLAKDAHRFLFPSCHSCTGDGITGGSRARARSGRGVLPRGPRSAVPRAGRWCGVHRSATRGAGLPALESRTASPPAATILLRGRAYGRGCNP